MIANARPDAEAMILSPDASDDPKLVEDVIHDVVLTGRETGAPVRVVVLDLSGVGNPGPWLKAAGPQIPDCNLRVALGPKHYIMAKALKLDAEFEWYADVELALRAGA